MYSALFFACLITLSSFAMHKEGNKFTISLENDKGHNLTLELYTDSDGYFSNIIIQDHFMNVTDTQRRSLYSIKGVKINEHDYTHEIQFLSGK